MCFKDTLRTFSSEIISGVVVTFDGPSISLILGRFSGCGTVEIEAETEINLNAEKNIFRSRTYIRSDRAHLPEQTDEVTGGHVMLFAATKQKFTATNPEVPPQRRGLSIA